MNRQKKNWLVDAVLLAGFLIAFMLDLTGLTLHQWLGVAVGLLAGYHLLAHWTWVNSVSQRLFGHTSRQANLYFWVDAGLYLGFLLISLTGLAISTWLNLTLGNFQAWRDFHILVSVLTLLLVVLKIGIHSRWIVSVARSYNFIPGSSPRENRSSLPTPFLPTPIKPAPVKVAADRRDFLKLMGIVGVGALLAGFSALDGLTESVGSESESDQGSLTTGYSLQAEALSASSDSCSVRCGRGCSYPGHCRRYTDSNQNNLYDYGECI